MSALIALALLACPRPPAPPVVGDVPVEPARTDPNADAASCQAAGGEWTCAPCALCVDPPCHPCPCACAIR